MVSYVDVVAQKSLAIDPKCQVLRAARPRNVSEMTTAALLG